MANTNTLTAVLDRILAGVLPTLRQNCVMPRLVNSAYSSEAGSQGSTMEVSVPVAVAAAAVSPSNTPPDTAGVTPTAVTIALDKWYEAGFFMSDKDLKDVRDGVVNGQMEECVKSIANQVNSDLLLLYKDVYGYVGTAGTTPFATGLDEAAAARKVLGQQLAPRTNLRGVIDLAAEANFSLVPNVLRANERGDASTIREGSIGRVLGIDWFPDQAVVVHTSGTASGATTDATGYAAGLKTITLASAGTGSILVGDIITFAGDSQTYVVTSGDASVAGGGTVSFEPGLAIAIAASTTAITLKQSGAQNLVFNPFAFAFVNRPFNGGILAGRSAGTFSSMQDPVSGLTLRVELTREHKRDKLAFDMLYGVKTVRRELATRMAGQAA